jgi:hypothetical protein
MRTGQVTRDLEVEPAAPNPNQALRAVAATATLSPLPRTIHTLWLEYEFGIGGRKAAKDFTLAERGKVKYNYHHRKVIWDVVAQLVRGGWLADVACDRIGEVYGRQLSVTSIINRMRKDRTTHNGPHPALRIVNL